MNNSDKMDVQVFPNPSNGEFYISVNSKMKFDLELYNITGKLVYSQKSNPADFSGDINLTGLSKGLYLLKVINNNEAKTSKLVIE